METTSETESTHAPEVDSILEGPREIELEDGGTLIVRPFTFGSLALAKKMNLTLFTGEGDEETEEGTEEPDAELTDDMMFQLAAFFWMQSQPVAEVLGAVRKDEWQDRVEEFAFLLPIHEMGNLMSEVNRISNMAADAAVDVIPQDSDSDLDKGSPGN